MDLKLISTVSIVLILGSQISTSESRTCGGVDIVFLLDTSRSIWGPHFREMLNFVSEMVGQFDIGPRRYQTRVGVITFGRRYWLQFFLKTYFNKRYLQRAIKSIRHKYERTTNIGAALQFTNTYMFKEKYGGRRNATHIVIVVTDGRSQNVKFTRNSALELKRSGAQVFAVGVGRGIDEDELRVIASDPDDQYVYIVGKFNALRQIIGQLPTSACEATTTPTTTTPTTTTTTTTTTPTTTATDFPSVTFSNDVLLADDPVKYCGGKNADLYFVLDSSNSIWPEDFKKEKEFVNNLIDVFDISPDKTRIGLLVYSTDIYPKIPLNSGFTKAQLKREVNKLTYVSGRTNTSDAIHFVRTMGFAPQLKRNKTVRIGIVLTDGISRDPLETKRQSQLARADGIHLFAIGIGNKTDKTELKRIANDPDDKFLFHVTSFRALDSIKSLLALTACGVLVDQPSQQMKVCGRNRVTDVVFVYDSAALGNQRSQLISYFVYDAVRHFDISQNTIQVGRLSDNCPVNSDIDVSSSSDLSPFNRIDFPGFYNLLERLHSSFTWRYYANRFAVLFVDESTQDIDRVLRFLKAYVKHNVLIVAIGERTMSNLGEQLSENHHLIRLPSYGELISSKAKLMEKLCQLI